MSSAKPLPFVQALVESLLKAERDRLNEVLGQILKLDQRAGNQGQAFLYGGRIFSLVPLAEARKTPIKPISRGLYGEVDYYLSEERALNRTAQRLRQGLSVVTTKCQTKEDFRNALPDILVREIDTLRNIPRTKPEGFMLDGNPRLHEQFKATVDLALSYAARRMLY